MLNEINFNGKRFTKNIRIILYGHCGERIIDMYNNVHFVDDFDCIEKTEYQFHGCYFHGNCYG